MKSYVAEFCVITDSISNATFKYSKIIKMKFLTHLLFSQHGRYYNSIIPIIINEIHGYRKLKKRGK